MSEQKRVIYTKEELAAKVKVPAIVEQDLKRIISDRLDRKSTRLNSSHRT